MSSSVVAVADANVGAVADTLDITEKIKNIYDDNIKTFAMYFIIYSLLIIILFTITELTNYQNYKYGELLSKNCKDEKTEFETPTIQYLFQSEKLNMQNFLILFVTFILISIILINYIKNNFDDNPFELDKVDINEKFIKKLISSAFLYNITLISIPITYIICISLFIVRNYKDFDENNDKDVEQKKHINNSFYAFLFINLFILLSLESYGIYKYSRDDNNKTKILHFMNILITFHFLSYFSAFIIQSFSKINNNYDKNYIWGDLWGLYHADIFATTTLFFTGAILLICIYFFVIRYVLKRDTSSENPVYNVINIENPVVHILLILIILAFFKLYDTDLNKDDISDKITQLNKKLKKFIDKDEITGTQYNSITRESLESIIESSGSGSGSVYAKYKENTIKTEDILKVLMLDYNFNTSCNDNDNDVDANAKFTTLLNFLNTYFISGSESEINFINKIITTVKNKYIGTANDVNTYERKKNVIYAFRDFIEYIREPNKYINENTQILYDTGETDSTTAKPIYDFTKRKLTTTIIDNYKALHVNNGNVTLIKNDYGDDGDDSDDEYHIYDDNNKYINNNEIPVKYKACLYVPFYDGDIEKVFHEINNYELQTLPKTELNTALESYKIEINKYTGTTVRIVFMEVFLILLIYIIIRVLSEFGLNLIYIMLLIIILIIIILVVLNIKIIVNNVK